MAYEHPSFHYHAEGHALSGSFVRPVPYTIETQASSSLPLFGGHAAAHVEKYALEHLVSMGKGYSHTSGSREPDGRYTSQSTVVVEDLNILDVLTADRLVARVTSEHSGKKGDEGHVITLGTRFENLRLSGYAVEVELDHSFFVDHKTYQSISDNLEELGKSGRMAEESDGVILCSLVNTLKVGSPNIDVKAHVITVPHFGKIYVGELLVEPGFKRLTLLRLELGSPDQGSVTVGGTGSNGRTWP